MVWQTDSFGYMVWRIDPIFCLERKPPSPLSAAGGSSSAPIGGKLNHGTGDAEEGGAGAARPPVLGTGIAFQGLSLLYIVTTNHRPWLVGWLV